MQLLHSVQIESFWPVQGQSWAVGSDNIEAEEIPVNKGDIVNFPADSKVYSYQNEHYTFS